LCADLARQHPSLRVDPTVLFVDNGSVLTSGGVTAREEFSGHWAAC
jgi:transcriptional regulator GlxA family with amidase domain